MATRKKSVLGFAIKREAIELTDEQLWRLLRYRDAVTGRRTEVNEHEFARLVELWSERYVLSPPDREAKAKLWKAGFPALRRKLGLPPRKNRRGPAPLRVLGKKATPEARSERADDARTIYEAVLLILEDGGHESDVVLAFADAWNAPVGSTLRVTIRKFVSVGLKGRRTNVARARGVVVEYLRSEGFAVNDDYLRRHILRGRIPAQES
jgi:hypothetical protein